MQNLKSEPDINDAEKRSESDVKPFDRESRLYPENYPLSMFSTVAGDVQHTVERPTLAPREPSPPYLHSREKQRKTKALKPTLPPFQTFSHPTTAESMDYPSPPPPSAGRIPISATRMQPALTNTAADSNPTSPQLRDIHEREDSYGEAGEHDEEEVAMADRMAIDFLRSVQRGSGKHRRQRSRGHSHSNSGSRTEDKIEITSSRRERQLPPKLAAKRPEALSLPRPTKMRTVDVNLTYLFIGDNRSMTEDFHGVQICETEQSDIFELDAQWLMAELYRFLPDFQVSCFKVRAKSSRNPERWVWLGSTAALDDLRPIPVLHIPFVDYRIELEFQRFDMPAMAYRPPKSLPPVHRLLEEQKYQIGLLARDSTATASSHSHDPTSPTSPTSPLPPTPAKRPFQGGAEESDSRAKRTRATDLKTWLENFRSVRAALKIKSEKTHNAVYRREEHSQPNFSLKRPYVRYLKRYLKAVKSGKRAKDSTLDGMLANARDYRPIQLMNYVRGLPDFDRKELQRGDDTDTDSESQYV